MSGCPGYLGVTISNRFDLEEVFRYDLLIFCPSNFNLTYSVPIMYPENDATFEVQLKDTRHTFSVYLTHVTFHNTEHIRLSQAIQSVSQPNASAVILAIAITLTGILAITFFVMFVYFEHAEMQIMHRFSAEQWMYQYNFCDDRDIGSPRNSLNAVQSKRTVKSCNKQHRLVMSVYVLLWTVYSLSFTFTIFSAILSFLVKTDLQHLSRIHTFRLEKHSATENLSSPVEQYREEELQRQSKLVIEMQHACNNYIDHQYTNVAAEISNALVSRYHATNNTNSSITHLMNLRYMKRLEAYNALVANYAFSFKSSLTTSIKQSITRYAQYLETVFQIGWLSFPQKIFNDSHSVKSYSTQLPVLLTGKEVEFGLFLEVEEVEAIQMWSVQFWERLVTNY